MWLRELRSVTAVSQSIRQSVSLVLRGKTFFPVRLFQTIIL